MCLRVAYVVNDKRQCRVMKAWKRLASYFSHGDQRFCTPFMAVVVPTSGLLLPRPHSSRSRFWFDFVIEGGFIHSYYRPMPNANWSQRPTGLQTHEYPAFAIGVVAWGDMEKTHQDQVSRAVYIPECDRDENRRARRVKLLSSKKMPTVNQLVAEFPELKKIAHLL